MEKVRITNIDTLSSFFDRLITERIKWYFFNKDNAVDNINHQEVVIDSIKDKINSLLKECFESGSYKYIGEKRTFDENSIVEELDELVINDINIGEADRARLEETTKSNPNLERMVVNEKRLRKANEGRARNKNQIDKLLKRKLNG